MVFDENDIDIVVHLAYQYTLDDKYNPINCYEIKYGLKDMCDTIYRWYLRNGDKYADTKSKCK